MFNYDNWLAEPYERGYYEDEEKERENYEEWEADYIDREREARD
ncbi:hypothetical protein [Helcococcus kunzii]